MVKNINMNLLSTQLMVITMMTLVQLKATSLKAFNEQIFQVTNRKVVNGKTWYYGKLSNGKYVWIKDTDLKKN